MAFLFQKFQEGVKALAKNRAFSRDPRQLQFEADINRLFLYTSYNRLGRDANESEIEEIIDVTKKTSFNDQQKQVQENIHSQVNEFCTHMDGILLPDHNGKKATLDSQINTAPIRSGLSLAVGIHHSIVPSHSPSDTDVPETNPLKREELSKRLKDLMGYKVVIKPSEIPHKEAGLGLFVDGEANMGDVIAFYPGLVYSPAYYRYIPGYPRVNADNSYLITRYDGTVINAQPWGLGGESRELWDWSTSSIPVSKFNDMKGSDRIWKMLSKPLDPTGAAGISGGGDILELRNPLAFAHFANHPGKNMSPNVMVCSYDFPLSDNKMRPYIPNVTFGGREEVNMKKYGTFWLKSWGGGGGGSAPPIIKCIVLVATRKLSEEEVLLNYRLSNTKLRPSWYIPVDEEEDRRRWS